MFRFSPKDKYTWGLQEERRPFFVKGASIFNFGEGENQFFYSRRIGRQPRHFQIPKDATELSRPEATTILGAAKIVGRTNTNTSFGIMEAVTAPEYAQIKEKGKLQEYLVEPLTNYFVGRVTQEWTHQKTLRLWRINESNPGLHHPCQH